MLTIVTVNYNGSERTKKLLGSLSKQTDPDFETIVIDNASEEADFQMLERGIGNAILVRNGQNLGFSGGNNIGINMALQNGASWVVLLNNDAWVEEGFISSLKAVLSRLAGFKGSSPGLLGVAIDEGDRTAYAGRLSWFRTEGRHIYDREKAVKETSRYMIGGGTAIHKNVFQKIGLLDEKYFLYFEDQDFSVRATKAGFPLDIAPDVKIFHQPSSTTKSLGDPLLLRYHYRNALYFNWKNGPWYVKVLVWPWSFWIMKKQILKMMIGYRSNASYAIINGVFDFYRNKMGKIEL